ncbi:MAG: M20 family metallopeptidase, partial [Akkermansiaceae bacterium]|nr:M20 family metallopeptidase [Akkermansiaceae bacterium]
MQSVTDLLQQLVRIPSVNPDGDPGTDQCGEQQIADWLANFLADAGLAASLEEIRPGRPNLIARCPGPEDRPRILLGPHLDTVGVGGMTIDPFGARIDDGKLWGRGASDTKGPMAAMIWGLLENRDQLARLPVAFDFVAFMSEESGQWGSRHFAKHHGNEYAFAVVGEPTSLDIVHVTKGTLWITLAATGASAHASQPERGENAIMKLVHALDVIDRDLGERLREFTHPALGTATLNVGMINGGTRANIIPDRASAQIDIRFPPDLVAGGATALRFVSDFVAEHDLPVELIGPAENPPMEVSPDHEWLTRLRAVHPESRMIGAPWFSDAAHLNDGGIPAICLGP